MCPVEKCIGTIRDIFNRHTEGGMFGRYSVDVDSIIVEFGEFVSYCQHLSIVLSSVEKQVSGGKWQNQWIDSADTHKLVNHYHEVYGLGCLKWEHHIQLRDGAKHILFRYEFLFRWQKQKESADSIGYGTDYPSGTDGMGQSTGKSVAKS